MNLFRLKWFENTSISIPVKYHLFFWASYFTFNVIRWGSYFGDYWYSLKSNLVEFPLHILIVYFHIYYLIPKFILSRKYKRYLLFLLLSLSLLYCIRTGLNFLLVTKNIWPEAEGVQQAFTFNHIIAVILGELYVVALVSAIKLTIDWVYEKKRAEDLEKIQLNTELNFLKSQIQPHFFFNTLNNLYALTLEKSDAASIVVLKLSDIMQYVLYDVKEPLISLYDEINYIQNYLDLEKLRYGDRVNSNINITGSIEEVNVPPLLFLPFIENCFKHGSKVNDIISVSINFDVLKNKMLKFRVENTFNHLSESNKKHGIGIQNVQRRLELLFNNKFKLKTTIKKQKFIATLKIPIQ